MEGFKKKVEIRGCLIVLEHKESIKHNWNNSSWFFCDKIVFKNWQLPTWNSWILQSLQFRAKTLLEKTCFFGISTIYAKVKDPTTTLQTQRWLAGDQVKDWGYCPIKRSR